MEINGFEVEEYNIHNIPSKAKYHTCPKCSEQRKKSKEKCAYVNWDTGVISCQHCGEITQMHTYKSKNEDKNYEIPKIIKKESQYSSKFLSYFKSRSISESTLKKAKVREDKEYMPQTKKKENCVCFDYYLDNKVINVKYRDARKNFKLYKGAEKIFYNLDNIAREKECVIVEGEIDALSFIEAGYDSVCSIPNGFNLKGNINLDYLDNYIHYFDNKKVIYICVDNDEAGRKGAKELVRRLGYDKCKIVDLNQYKDANEYLISKGKESLLDVLKQAKYTQVEGIFSAENVKESMYDRYRNGQNRGTTTYVEMLDDAWTWRGGEVNLWTGYQNEGKSLFLNQLCAIRAYWEDAKVAVFSPENFPLDDFNNDIIEMFIGKSTDPYYSNNYMSEKEFNEGFDFVNKNFFLIYPEANFTLDSIFERTKFLIKTKGIRTLILDPYNTIEHKMNKGEREDLYISRFMSKLKKFAIEYDISVNLVAHQLTARIDTSNGGRYFKPDVNYIKGGGTFGDKADNVIAIWRPNRKLDYKDTTVWFMSQKIKKQKLVGVPQEVQDITFNIRQNRYYFDGFSPFSKIDGDRLGIKIDEKPTEKKIKPLEPNEAFDFYEERDDDIPF